MFSDLDNLNLRIGGTSECVYSILMVNRNVRFWRYLWTKISRIWMVA